MHISLIVLGRTTHQYEHTTWHSFCQNNLAGSRRHPRLMYFWVPAASAFAAATAAGLVPATCSAIHCKLQFESTEAAYWQATQHLSKLIMALQFLSEVCLCNSDQNWKFLPLRA